MIGKNSPKFLTALVTTLCLFMGCLFSGTILGGDGPQLPVMPAHWKIISDFQAPPEQVTIISNRLGANLKSVRNTIYDVEGKRVQINVTVSSDAGSAELLMTKLRSMKTEEALLKKGLVIYEFVGQNDVLPLIAEGRAHLERSSAQMRDDK